MHPRDFRHGLYTVIKGFIDESGNKDVFCLSCLLGRGSNWDFFQSDWNDVIAATNKSLKAHGRPTISRYHAADCSSRVGEFTGWTTDEQIELTKALLKVFSKPSNALNVVGYTLDLHELVQVLPETAPDPYGFGYALLIKCLMDEIGDIAAEANKGDVTNMRFPLIHDRCGYDAVLLRSFNSMKEDPNFKYKSLFPTLAPMGWEDCPPLQPADLLAYENFKEHERRSTDRGRRRTLKELLDLEAFGGRAKGFDKKGIQALKKYLTADIRQQILLEANIRGTKQGV